MIAPRNDSPASDESDLDPDASALPHDIVVSVMGINITAPTQLLTRGSPYWTARVNEHGRAYQAGVPPTQQQPDAPLSLLPLVLDESVDGHFFSTYEFVVYVGLLQAEEYMRMALSMGLPAPEPVYDPLFRSFALAGMPLPTAQTLDNVSVMAAFFGRNDLARLAPAVYSAAQREEAFLQEQRAKAWQQVRPASVAVQEWQRREHQLRGALEHTLSAEADAEVARQRRGEEQAPMAPWPESGWSEELTATGHDAFFASNPVIGNSQTLVQLPWPLPATSLAVSKGDVMSLPPMLSPRLLYFSEQRPTPPPRHLSPFPGTEYEQQQQRLTLREPALLPSSLPASYSIAHRTQHPPPPYGFAAGESIGFSSAPMFPFLPPPSAFSTFPAPRVEAPQLGIAPLPRFPERFQSGRAATRRHHPYHRLNTPPYSTEDCGVQTMSATSASDWEPPRPRHRLPDAPVRLVTERRERTPQPQTGEHQAAVQSWLRKVELAENADRTSKDDGEDDAGGEGDN